MTDTKSSLEQARIAAAKGFTEKPVDSPTQPCPLPHREQIEQAFGRQDLSAALLRMGHTNHSTIPQHCHACRTAPKHSVMFCPHAEAQFHCCRGPEQDWDTNSHPDSL